MTEIDLRNVKIALDAIFKHLIQTHQITKVPITKNFYWNIPTPNLYDLADDRPKLDVGSIIDEWQFCQNLVTGESPPVANQLTELAPILRYLGEKLGEELAPRGG